MRVKLIEWVRAFFNRQKHKPLDEPGYRALLENIPATTYINELTGSNETLYISPQASRLLGYPREAFITDPTLWSKLLHPDDREAVLSESARTNETLEPFSVDYRMVAWGGRTVWLHDEAVVVRDEAGNPQYWLGVWTDITERKRIEATGRASEERYRSFIAQTTEGIRRYDLDEPIPIDLPEDEQLARMLKHMYIAECNDAFAQMYGLTRASELIGRYLGEMGLERDPKNIEALRGFIRARYRVIDVESYERDAQGHARVFLINTIGIVENGCLQRVWGMQRDITERKISEVALQQREIILAAITFAAERFLTVSDWRKNIDAVLERLGQAINASHAYIFEHYTEEAARFKSMRYEWVAPDQSPDIGKAIYQNVPVRNPAFEVSYHLLSSGQPFIGDRMHLAESESAFLLGRELKALLEMPIFVGDAWWGTIGFDDCRNERLWSQVELDLLKVAANILSAAIQRNLADHEIQTLNATLEQRVQERTALLESANKELETFSYSVSHDLRAPLRAVQSFSNLLVSDYSAALDAEGRGFLEKVIHASSEMNEKIEGLLSFARLTRAGLKPIHLNMSKMAEHVIETLRAAQPDRNVTCRITDGLSARGDAVLIRTVLENLIGNAWKYSAQNAEPVIEFGVVPPSPAGRGAGGEGETIFFVRDNGAGFNMKYADKLFRAFQRLHRVDEFPGHGIGLATVQRIIHRHGGRVWAESEVGQGATFYFTLG